MVIKTRYIYIDNCEEHKEKITNVGTETPIFDKDIKYFDFSVEDIHGIQEITEDDAYSSYSMDYIDTLPYIN